MTIETTPEKKKNARPTLANTLPRVSTNEEKIEELKEKIEELASSSNGRDDALWSTAMDAAKDIRAAKDGLRNLGAVAVEAAKVGVKDARKSFLADELVAKIKTSGETAARRGRQAANDKEDARLERIRKAREEKAQEEEDEINAEMVREAGRGFYNICMGVIAAGVIQHLAPIAVSAVVGWAPNYGGATVTIPPAE